MSPYTVKEEKPEELPQLDEAKIEELKKEFEKIKAKLDKFKDKVLSKYKKEIVGIALLPPPKVKEKKDEFHVLILVDDKDTKDKFGLRTKLIKGVDEIAKNFDEKVKPQVMLLFELVENCYDAKYEILQLISLSAPLYDPKDLLAAVRIAEVHKTMVLKKFEKYVVSYVAAGSLFRGEKSNDIDIYIIIDDTDVKRMSRIELKDKLGAIIRGMGTEASLMTQVKKAFHIQVYILTDFWENVKDAHPVIFTFLRDGVPLYDRGVFMPWKLLLKMGRVRPSPEAIEMNMDIGEKMLERVNFKLLSAVAEDIYYATLNPSQAALMLYGVSPPTPKETVELLDSIFVKREKLLEKKYVDILEKIRKYYKDIEHKKIKEISGKEVDELLKDAKDYLKRINKLFEEIDKSKSKESFNEVYENCLRVAKDTLEIEGSISNDKLIKKFNEELVNKRKVGKEYLETLKELIRLKGKLSNVSNQEVEKVKREARVFIRTLVEYIQRKKGLKLERNKIRFKYGDNFGEVLLLGKEAFIINDEGGKKEVSVAEIGKDGGLTNINKSSLENMEKKLSDANLGGSVFVKEKLFSDLKKLFGKDIEIML